MTEHQYEVQSLSQGGWDHIITEDTLEAAQEMLNDYDRNETLVPHRIRKLAVKNPDAVKTYKVIRMFESDDYETEILARGLTLEEAQAHCNSPETSSSTAQSSEATARTFKFGRWFDGYNEE